MRRLAWLGLVVVVGVALVIGATDRDPATADQRVHRIGESVMCPACSGETVTNSQAPVAVQIRRQIAAKVEAGQSDQEIRDSLAASYGERVILNPPRSGIAGLVWVLPVAALVAAFAGLVVAFRRWGSETGSSSTPEDRAAAERARQAAAAEPRP